MAEREIVTLSRDVQIITVPDGDTGSLPAGAVVTIHQALGSNYTVITDYGHMVRISANDADALGKQSSHLQALTAETDSESVAQNCREVLKTIYDPEIPVNIVDLGLVYDCHVNRNAEGGHDVHIRMTLTAPGCGMGPVIQADVEQSIKALPGVSSVDVEVVLDPPWSREMMSEVALVQLGMF